MARPLSTILSLVPSNPFGLIYQCGPSKSHCGQCYQPGIYRPDATCIADSRETRSLRCMAWNASIPSSYIGNFLALKSGGGTTGAWCSIGYYAANGSSTLSIHIVSRSFRFLSARSDHFTQIPETRAKAFEFGKKATDKRGGTGNLTIKRTAAWRMSEQQTSYLFRNFIVMKTSTISFERTLS